MKLFSKLLLAFGTLILFSCGNQSGIDPHLSVEEQQEELEINLVGKWKIRPPLTSGLTSKGATPAECSLNEIEFFEDRSYLFVVSVETENNETTTKIYRGVYDILFEESEGEQEVSKIVFMDEEYTRTSTFPETGTVATLDEIVLTETEVSFRLQYGPSTAGFCLTGTSVDLGGDKEPELEPNAPANSNHELIQKEWRLLSVMASLPEGETDEEVICRFFEDDFYDRCFDEATGAFSQDCPQAVTTTLLISGYGTYLFSFYDVSAQLISTDQGVWRWRTDTTAPYTVFDVAEDEDSFAETDQRISIQSLDDANMVLTESVEETNEEGETFTISLQYTFQLASLPFQGHGCGDLSALNN